MAIIGQNGAGKSTLAKLMNGLLRPTQGEVLVDNQVTSTLTTAQVSKKVGYVFQNPDNQIFQSTVEKEVGYGLKLDNVRKNRRVNEVLEITGMEKYRQDNPYDLPLSLRKFVALAAVLAMDTHTVILDEPTAGQDLNGLKKLESIIKRLESLGKTIIVISHDMNFVAQNFSKVIVMAKSEIIKVGSPDVIFSSPQILDRASLQPPDLYQICQGLELEKLSVDCDEVSQMIEQVNNQME